MAIVNERHNPSKPVQVDPKTGKPLASTPARAASPSVPEADGSGNAGFFGSFFAAKNKKKAAAMEAPPPTLKASGALSERETIEVEVISMFSPGKDRGGRSRLTERAELLVSSYFNIVKRTMIDMVPKAVMYELVQYVNIFPDQ
jgi:vacuolar protein sorting-associated protein 1